MPALEDTLAELAAHPPVAPTPVAEIQGRARRRARRRRVTVGLVAVLAVAALGAGIAVAVTSSSDDGSPVVAEGGPTSPSLTTEVGVAAAGITLDPASGFADGSAVEIALVEPASGPVTIAQCGPDLTRAPPGVEVDTCTEPVSADAAELPPFVLARIVDTPTGPVDCAASAALCHIVVTVGGPGSTDRRSAPLVFADDLPTPTQPAVVVDGDDGTVGDGDTLQLTFTGVATGDEIVVQQCVEGGGCDVGRRLTARVQDGPETQLLFTAFHDVLADDPATGTFDVGWRRCEPCTLVVQIDTADVVADLPLVMEPSGAPIRPALILDPAGPLAAGGEVTVRASGLQPGSVIPLSTCLASAVAARGSGCRYEEGFAEVEVADDGTFVAESFPLPAAGETIGTGRCDSAPGVCGVALENAPAAFAPFDLTG